MNPVYNGPKFFTISKSNKKERLCVHKLVIFSLCVNITLFLSKKSPCRVRNTAGTIVFYARKYRIRLGPSGRNRPLASPVFSLNTAPEPAGAALLYMAKGIGSRAWVRVEIGVG